MDIHEDGCSGITPYVGWRCNGSAAQISILTGTSCKPPRVRGKGVSDLKQISSAFMFLVPLSPSFSRDL